MTTNDGEVTTWHHGLIARWWANFNTDGPEIEHFRADVEAGQPALDVGCGTGRLLVPWVAAGLDVDGVDPAADMITACREAAAKVGHTPHLAVQALHQLVLPRRYGVAILCGSFAIGGTREHDLEGLRRVRAHLRPGGHIAMDYETSEVDPEQWKRFRARPIDDAPPPAHERKLAPDGFTYALRHRVTAVDADNGCAHRELQAWQWQGEQLVAYETHALTFNVYTRDQIVDALRQAGFMDVRVSGGYHGGEPEETDRFLVYRARNP